MQPVGLEVGKCDSQHLLRAQLEDGRERVRDARVIGHVPVLQDDFVAGVVVLDLWHEVLILD